MSNIWFIGDLHFGHKKISELRGFASIEQHDLKIFDTWNAQIQSNDLVYVLGDISSGKTDDELHALEILTQLRGHKRLISGNHDSVSGVHRSASRHIRLFNEVFESIRDFGQIRLNNSKVLLSHFPYASQGDGPEREDPRYLEFRLPDNGLRLIHAHTHHNHATNGSQTNREFCVSWDAHNSLVNIGKIDKWIQGKE